MAINSVNNLETTDKADASKPPAKRWVYVIPVAVIMYMLAYLDRTNTAMILPYINSDTSSQIHLTKADEGIVSGIFFFGYMFLQIPAAILAERWSAKKTVAILMFLWGFAAMAVSFVQSNGQFYTARFVLGFFEGGVWPSVLILIANWFPLKERARANSLWMCCLPLSSVLISPITGALLDHFSWRTVLFVEGIPPLIWAIVWLLVVSDHPHIRRRTRVHRGRTDRRRSQQTHHRWRWWVSSRRPQRTRVATHYHLPVFHGRFLWLHPVASHRGQGAHVRLIGIVRRTRHCHSVHLRGRRDAGCVVLE